MTRDPAAELRADIPVLHPLQRAAYLAEITEAKEENARQARMAERRAEAEARAAERQARQRMELLTRGHTTEELAAYTAEAAERKAARIAELEAELDRIDPARRRVQAQRQQDAQAAVTLARAKRPDEFMRQQVRELERRGQAEGDRKYRQRLDEVTRAAEAGYVREISR